MGLCSSCTKAALHGLAASDTEGFDRLGARPVQEITLDQTVGEIPEEISLLGVIKETVLYKNNADGSLNYIDNKQQGQLQDVTWNVSGSRCLPLSQGLLLTDSTGRTVYYLHTGKEGIEATRLDAIPVLESVERMNCCQQEDWLYLAVSHQDGLNLYRMSVTGENNPSWELVNSLENHLTAPFFMAVQSDGIDNCLYIFSPQEGIFAYNLRLHQWARKGSVTVDLSASASAFGKGAGHIVVLDSSAVAVFLYNTITNSFSSLAAPQEDNEVSGARCIQESYGTIYKTGYQPASGHIQQVEWQVVKIKNGFNAIDITVLILYFAALVFIGYYYSKRQKNPDDYFKGGHRIPWWAAGLSLFGTSLSAITFMAIPAKAYATDWSYMLFNSGIVLVAPIIMYVFIPFFRKLNITTAYQYLEVRFNALIRMICSVAFIVLQVGRMGVILLLPAIAINVVTGFNIFLCVALMGVFSIIYTRMGGIEAVVWTDALQVVILLGGAVYAIFHIVGEIPGGWTQTIAIAVQDGKLSFGSTAFDLTNGGIWTVLIATFFTNLTTYGTDQSMVQRYLTTSSQKAARKSVMTNALLVIPATVVFFLIGTVLYVYYKTNPAQATSTLDSNDAIFPWYIYTNLPVGMVGMLIAGIFAAAMSTLSGSMNSAATAYITDIRPKLFKNKPQADLKTAKTATLAVGALSLCFAFLMATWNINSLWDEFNKILGLIMGSMGGLFLLGMITRRANAPGALIGMIISIIVQAVVAAYTPVNLLLYTTVGFITCFVTGYIASLFFTHHNKN